MYFSIFGEAGSGGRGTAVVQLPVIHLLVLGKQSKFGKLSVLSLFSDLPLQKFP